MFPAFDPVEFRRLLLQLAATPRATLDAPAAAALLGISEATVWRYWSDRARVPLAAWRLVYLLARGDLGTFGPEWAGWSIYRRWDSHSGCHRVFLADPAHQDYSPGDLRALPYLYALAAERETRPGEPSRVQVLRRPVSGRG